MSRNAYQAARYLNDKPRMLKWLKRALKSTLLAEGGDQASYREGAERIHRMPGTRGKGLSNAVI
jgi:hypothetical protein